MDKRGHSHSNQKSRHQQQPGSYDLHFCVGSFVSHAHTGFASHHS